MGRLAVKKPALPRRSGQPTSLSIRQRSQPVATFVADGLTRAGLCGLTWWMARRLS
jgi:hypothetical protein